MLRIGYSKSTRAGAAVERKIVSRYLQTLQ